MGSEEEAGYHSVLKRLLALERNFIYVRGKQETTGEPLTLTF